MREIKFRGFSVKENKFVYGVFFKKGWGFKNGISAQGETGVWDIKDGTIGQYTGLKDKNGVQIFEGDIVKNVRNGISRKVYWDTHCASFHLSKRGREKPGVEYWSLSNPEWNYEVIGNIYENSDLLEGSY